MEPVNRAAALLAPIGRAAAPAAAVLAAAAIGLAPAIGPAISDRRLTPVFCRRKSEAITIRLGRWQAEETSVAPDSRRDWRATRDSRSPFRQDPDPMHQDSYL